MAKSVAAAAQPSSSGSNNSTVVVADAAPPPASGGMLLGLRRPAMRLTTEFDSDSRVFVHKVSCKVLDGLAKLKLSFLQNTATTNKSFEEPQVSFTSKYLSIHYDVEQQNALFKASADFAPGLQLLASHDLNAQQGEVSMVADLAPHYKLQLTSPIPSFDLPKATLRFPLGEVSLEEKVEDQEDATPKILSINGILKGQLLNGVCNALYQDENLNLRYAYKDDQMAFIPSISLPSNVLSFAFKRRFSPSNKFSYWYNFDTNYWSAVYKHTVGKDLKVKAGYDSEVRLSWASLWVGDEAGTAKSAPMKMKVQVMVQVPRDDVRSSGIMFRVKKRWDI